MTPRFSITIPAYNAEATLSETVASVQAQTFADFEIVICNDGSTDSTLEIAQDLASRDDRIKVVSQQNKGSGGAYNTAIRNASSDLFVMLSADDLLLPTHLEEMDRFVAANPDASIFACDGYYQYEDGTRERANSHLRWADPVGCELSDLLIACFYGVGSVNRRSAFDAVGGFREDAYAEDYPFWIMAVALGLKHRHLDKPLSVHRRNSVQKSADALRMRKADADSIRYVIDSGKLHGSQLELARSAEARLRRNIRIREALTKALGSDVTERLVALTRSRRFARQADHAERTRERG